MTGLVPARLDRPWDPLRPSATSLENPVLGAAERRSRELPPPLRGRVGEGGTNKEAARASTAASDLGPPSGLRPPPPQGGRTRLWRRAARWVANLRRSL